MAKLPQPCPPGLKPPLASPAPPPPKLMGFPIRVAGGLPSGVAILASPGQPPPHSMSRPPKYPSRLPPDLIHTLKTGGKADSLWAAWVALGWCLGRLAPQTGPMDRAAMDRRLADVRADWAATPSAWDPDLFKLAVADLSALANADELNQAALALDATPPAMLAKLVRWLARYIPRTLEVD